MNIIRNYVDSMFKDLPKTIQVIEIKENILDNMQDKYDELIRDGESEATASREVISQFGDMNEILKELDIDINENDEEEVNYLSEEEVTSFISWRNHFRFGIGFGVFCCINAVGISGALFAFNNNYLAMIASLLFFLFVGIGVILFIFFGIKESKYAKLIDNPYVDEELKQAINKKIDDYRTNFAICIAIGVLLCIVAVGSFPLVAHILKTESLAIFVFFFLISIGVLLFIIAGIKQDSYEIFSKERLTKKEKEKKDGVDQLCGVIMMVCTIFFLIIGVLFGAWHPGWIVFPIGGICCGILETVSGVNKK